MKAGFFQSRFAAAAANLPRGEQRVCKWRGGSAQGVVRARSDSGATRPLRGCPETREGGALAVVLERLDGLFALASGTGSNRFRKASRKGPGRAGTVSPSGVALRPRRKKMGSLPGAAPVAAGSGVRRRGVRRRPRRSDSGTEAAPAPPSTKGAPAPSLKGRRRRLRAIRPVHAPHLAQSAVAESMKSDVYGYFWVNYWVPG